MSKDKSTALGRVYAAENPDELAGAYADWSDDYDRDLGARGYTLPFVVAAWVARYVPRGAGPILDAGCGTGLSGPYMRALGYERVEGLDFSEAMLALARQRGSYSQLTKAELGKPLPYVDARFSAVFSAGVFTEGHAPASALDELVRITRRNGHVVFTVRDSVLDSGAFTDVIEWLEKAERWRPIEESPLFRSFANAEDHVQVKAFVFEVL